MTKHNATWSEELYYSEDDTIDQNPDPQSEDHGKSGYWDYRDE